MAKTFYRSIDDSFDRFEVKYKETEKILHVTSTFLPFKSGVFNSLIEVHFLRVFLFPGTDLCKEEYFKDSPSCPLARR